MKLPHEIGLQLVCPQCRAHVSHVGDAYVCRSSDCRRLYPILDGIPKFLIDDARVLAPDEWRVRLPQNGNGLANH